MITLFAIVHVIVCLFLIGVVLLQSGKAADLAGAFGGMGSQTAFGPRGTATLLSRWTTIAAAVFMVTSLALAVLESRTKGGGQTSVIDRVQPKQAQPAGTPAAPGSIGVTTSGAGNAPNTQNVPLPVPQQGGTPASGQAPATNAPATPAPAPAPTPATPPPAQK